MRATFRGRWSVRRRRAAAPQRKALPSIEKLISFFFLIDLDNFFNFVDLVDFVDLVNFSLFNRIVGVSPCHPQERTGVVVRESNTLKGFKDFCP